MGVTKETGVCGYALSRGYRVGDVSKETCEEVESGSASDSVFDVGHCRGQTGGLDGRVVSSQGILPGTDRVVTGESRVVCHLQSVYERLHTPTSTGLGLRWSDPPSSSVLVHDPGDLSPPHDGRGGSRDPPVSLSLVCVRGTREGHDLHPRSGRPSAPSLLPDTDRNE